MENPNAAVEHWHCARCGGAATGAAAQHIAAPAAPQARAISDLATHPAGLLGVQFVHVATAANISSNWTSIDHPLTNGNPNAIIFVTPNWNPGGVGGTYDNHPIGVWYDGSKWAIFNQNLAAVPLNAAFNVYVFGNYHVYQPLVIH